MRRIFVTALFVSLILSALTGCTSTNSGGNGSGPPPAPAQATVESVSPTSVLAGSASFTVTVNGLNFLPTTTLLWNLNTPLTTTYVSSTVLQAQVPASLVAKPGTGGVSPLGGVSLNLNANITILPPTLTGNHSFSVATVSVQANDMAFDQLHQQFYLSVASSNGTNANTIVVLNPQTATLSSGTSTNGGAGRLAVSSDGTYLYAGLNSAGSVQRYTLPALQSDLAIPLGSGSFGSYYAIDVEVQPGSPHSVAVSRGNLTVSPREQGGIVIYDDAVARPQSVPGFGPSPVTIDALIWNPNGQNLYGVDTESSSPGLYIMSVSAAGVQLQTPAPVVSPVGDVHFESTTGYLYTNNGNVIDPRTGGVIGSFPLNTIEGGFSEPPLMVTDGQLNIAYFFGQPEYLGYYVLEAYDLTHFTFLGAVALTNVSGIPTKMCRWGNNGLAILTHTGSGSLGDAVYLVSGGFVTSPAP